MAPAIGPVAELHSEVLRMSGCTPPDQAAFESGSARGVTPPLLPTLAMAAILGGASYLCQEPAIVAPASVPATAVAAAPEATAETPFIPAPLAFQAQFPLVIVAQAEATAQVHRTGPRPARLAAPRRFENPRLAVAKVAPTADKASQGSEKVPQAFARPPQGREKALPFVAEAEVSHAAAEGDEGVLPGIGLPDVTLPDIALPFAPTIRAVTQAGAAAGAFMGAKTAAAGTFVSAQGAALGAGTATLGAAVSGWVGRLR
ncbi:hypothetical protein ASF58_20935 [Methylobacterium sp. Leaf125]|nr:hypothetical protein ASF58_20935 [Methylobacterium sp. Leaf125]